MKSKMQIFNNGEVNLPVKEINGEILFDAEGVAIGLGLSEVKNGKVYARWRTINKYLSQHLAKGDYITEPQFYKLAIKANNHVAQKFQDWVTSEVLPAIRKQGIYMTDEKAAEIVTNKDSLADLLRMASDQLKEKDIKIGQLEEQVDELMEQKSYLDVILSTTDPIAITQIAADYGYSARAFNTLLNEARIQHKVNGQWILYRTHMGKNYTVSKTKTFKDKAGNDHAKMQTYWTQTGRKAIYRILKENMEILPLLERDDIE